MKRHNTPDLVGCIPEALEYISTIRQVVNQVPCLVGYTRPGHLFPSKRTKVERGRRKGERELLAELSRYYVAHKVKRGGGMKNWDRPTLLKEGKFAPDLSLFLRHSTHLISLLVLEDLKVRYPPPGLFAGTTP